ncbi:uncharacterized protein LOC130901657 isoform X2 [Diorhabda carinulata]|uniref:uncharacterized protein LOC130901657 isoform X2 n=1 Tax=Diorhabda carinulata TaxID=1163345 RepID=UPI0025A2A96F|nr:uncharacterized protein LOC130901657 isoform X2 [Diorhabda carinulata]
MASSARFIQSPTAWCQRKVNLRPQHRGVHLVTEEILRQLPELNSFVIGLCHIQILHTSASLALNESWDPDVRDDMEMMLNKIVPEGLPYRHSCEGPDDMEIGSTTHRDQRGLIVKPWVSRRKNLRASSMFLRKLEKDSRLSKKLSHL